MRLVVISLTQTSISILQPSPLVYLLSLSMDAVLAKEMGSLLLLLVYMSSDWQTTFTLMWGHKLCVRCILHGDPG